TLVSSAEAALAWPLQVRGILANSATTKRAPPVHAFPLLQGRGILANSATTKRAPPVHVAEFARIPLRSSVGRPLRDGSKTKFPQLVFRAAHWTRKSHWPARESPPKDTIDIYKILIV